MNNNIAITQQQGKLVTSSREVARVFEKKHFHILRDYDDLIESLDQDFTESNFGWSEYKDASGKKNRELWMTQAGFTLLVMGFTGERALKFKVAYINAFESMAAQLTQPKQLSRRELALLVIEQEDRIEQLALENNQLKPKAKEFDEVFDVLNMWTSTQAIAKAKLFGVSAIKLNLYFKSLGYIYKNGKHWMTTKLGASTGFFNYKESEDADERKFRTLCLTNLGVDYLYNNKEDIEVFCTKKAS